MGYPIGVPIGVPLKNKDLNKLLQKNEKLIFYVEVGKNCQNVPKTPKFEV